MKRARLRTEKPVSLPHQEADSPSAQSELPHPGVNRRTRTSAAMIGLALSMGTTGLVLPRHDDGAAAAEPKVSDTTVSSTFSDTSIALSSEEQPGAAMPVSTVSMVEHRVQEGQTLEQLADQYQVNVWSIAVANGLTPSSSLSAGQVLKVPVPGGSNTETFVASTDLSLVGQEGNAEAAVEQNSALDRLRLQRERLRGSLAELRSEESDSVVGSQSRNLEASGRSEGVANLDRLADSASLDTPAQSAGSTQQRVARVAPVPGEAAPVIRTEAGAEPQVYRVNPGDTVAAIARSHNIPQSLLIDANGLSNPNVIFVGQTLTVPVQQAVTPAASVEVASETLSAAILPAAQETTAELPSAQMPVLTPVSSPVATPDSGIGGSSATSSAAPAVPTLLAQSAADVSLQSSDDETASPRRQVAVAPMPESAVSPLNDEASPVQTDASPVSPFSPYVSSLLSEIKNLQQRNQPTAAAVQPELTPAAVQSPAAGEVAVSPHFNPSGLDRQVTETRPISSSPQPSGTPAESSAASGLVATAPLGSESYDPLLQPITGRMVSPDLPPLPGADTFLPEDGLFNGYVWPTRGLLTSGYGWRWGRMHQGIDIAADVGTPIYAAANGVVEFAGWNSGGYGNMVEIRHADGSMTRYAHMNAIYAQVGQQLSQGEQVGEMGSTGYSTGPHLHFEVHLPDQGTVNPMAYLPAQ